MIFYPAVDILGGRAVRLTQGDYERGTVYEEDPAKAATRWVEDGARRLHVVDLDGAKQGWPVNLDHVARLARSVPVPIQLGGGLRSLADVRSALAAGAQRVVLGTAAVRDLDTVAAIVEAYGHRVIGSIDVRDETVTTQGWTEATQVRAEQLIERLQGVGMRNFVFSDVGVDGTMEGPDLGRVEAVSDMVRGRFLYAGGISSLEDVRGLAGLRRLNLAGVIVGRALYEGSFSVHQAQATLDSA